VPRTESRIAKPRPRTKTPRGEDVAATVAVPADAVELGGFAVVALPTGRACQVKIPAGVKDGALLRLRGMGSRSQHGGNPGDALVTIKIAPNHDAAMSS
jgi:DnaJ-class molecular chaperone